VYRWGCAGRNNVYLLSHAWSTFKPLHDAYTAGRLRKGLQVVYADGGGRVHTYAAIWWKVVAPTTAASWAWASLSTPSMTLQTCVGANSQIPTDGPPRPDPLTPPAWRRGRVAAWRPNIERFPPDASQYG
jgi:hypothetical protein